MRELDIPFEEQLTPFSNEADVSPFEHFSPTAQVPCLYDADTAIWDSLAICEYLAEVHDGVWPADRLVRGWARSVTAEMHSGFEVLRTLCGMSVGVRVKLHNIPAGLVSDVRRIEEIWQQGLSRFGGPFLAGASFSAVDAFFAPVVFRWQTYDLIVNEDAAAYCRRILSLPSMQQWQHSALQETWRDASHDDEMSRYGQVVEDLRQSAG